ncbi:glycosyltransferase [Acidisoma sp. S159]|uniref:glycosyltransferase n=1 Tax=Acidisoma sp. S159 TaxID=1747225 RepID=UPI00210F7C5B|nr:glycosyltransferase [Acidisoma sp. S159]
MFHWIWLGRQALPREQKDWMETWLRMHPGWLSHLWTDENRPTLLNEACFQASTCLAQRSDILRYELVLQRGGVYIDTDFEPLKNIEELVEGVDAFAGRESRDSISNALFGCTPRHCWMEKVVAELSTSFRRETTIMEQTGPVLFTRVTHAHSSVHVLDPKYFYPYSWRELNRRSERFPGAYAVHHWAYSWKAEFEAECKKCGFDTDHGAPGTAVPC